MPSVSNVVVEQVSSKDRTTRFGVKKAYSFKADGQWYATGFKDSRVAVGDCICFEFTIGSYGNDVDITTIVKGTPSPNSTVTPGPAKAGQTSTYGGKGVFPIPPLDGQRAIVRQNALTNARELFATVLSINNVHAGSGIVLSDGDIETMTSTIVKIARAFEAYSCGDSDLEEMERELEEEMKKAA